MLVTAKGKTVEIEKGSRFQDLVPFFQEQEEYPLLLAKVGSRIFELHKKVPEEDFTVEWITIRDRIGMQSYQRSAVFMLLKAFFHHCKDVPGFNVTIDYWEGAFTAIFPEGSKLRQTCSPRLRLPWRSTLRRKCRL